MAIEIIGAIGGVTQGVARLLGLSKTARLRRAINDHIKLYASLENRDELKQAATQVAGLIDLQTSQLVRREEDAARREYEWSNLVIGIVVGGVLAAPLWWLLPAHSLWQGALAIVLGILAVLFAIVGASMVRKQPKGEEPSKD